jgi:hypothetical protein
MPKPKIKKQIISVDVLFESGDRLKDISNGTIVVLTKLDKSKGVLILGNIWEAASVVLGVTWFTLVENRVSREYILGSDLAKELYGGSASLQDLLDNFKFEGSTEVQEALNELGNDDNAT